MAGPVRDRESCRADRRPDFPGVADQMTSTRHGAVTRTGSSSVHPTSDGSVLAAPARLCFIVEERYENDVMPGAVVDVLRPWSHEVDVLRPHGMVADRPPGDPAPDQRRRRRAHRHTYAPLTQVMEATA